MVYVIEKKIDNTVCCLIKAADRDEVKRQIDLDFYRIVGALSSKEIRKLHKEAFFIAYL